MSLLQLLSDGRNDILARFVRGVEQKDLPPTGLPPSVLIDHIPLFLEEIATEMSRAAGARMSMDAAEVNATARQHGEQRWKVGYDLEAVVREYAVLRHAILESARARGLSLSTDESEVLSSYLNVGVAGATAEYVRSSEARLKERQKGPRATGSPEWHERPRRR